MKKTVLFLFLAIPFLSHADYSQEKISGPWLQGRWGKKFRYVTTYSTTTVDQAVKGFPWFKEECHDDGDTDWSQWNQMITYEVAYSGSIGFDLLGFSLEFGRDVGRSHSVGFNRWISATAGISAKHTLHEVYDVMKGGTRMEVMYKDGTIVDQGWERPFEISHLNYGLRVKRDILEVCEEGRIEEFMSKE